MRVVDVGAKEGKLFVSGHIHQDDLIGQNSATHLKDSHGTIIKTLNVRLSGCNCDNVLQLGNFFPA